MKSVKEIMKNFPSSCGKNDKLESVTDQMRSGEIGFLPVVDQNKRVLGTITYQDICTALVKERMSKEELKVFEVMNPNVFTINTHDDEATALRMMRRYHLGYLPVVDFDNRLKGVVSFMSIARRIVKLKHGLRKLNY